MTYLQMNALLAAMSQSKHNEFQSILISLIFIVFLRDSRTSPGLLMRLRQSRIKIQLIKYQIFRAFTQAGGNQFAWSCNRFIALILSLQNEYRFY